MRIIEMIMRIIAASLFLYYWHIALGQVKIENIFKNRERVQMICIFISGIAAGVVTFMNRFVQGTVYDVYLPLFIADIIIIVLSVISKRAGWHGDCKNKEYFSYNEEETKQMKTDADIEVALPSGYATSKMYQIKDNLFVGQIPFTKGQSVIIEANPIDEANHVYTLESVFDRKRKLSIYEILMWIHLITMDIGFVLVGRGSIIHGLTSAAFICVPLVLISFLFTINLIEKQEKKNIISRLIELFFLVLYVVSFVVFCLELLGL